MIRFSFLDPVNGYIQLIPDKQQDLPHTGWKIMPHKKPLVVRLYCSISSLDNSFTIDIADEDGC